MNHVVWRSQPELRNPVLVLAFEGWNDAGDAATTALDYVAHRYDADVLATIDPESFFDFSSNRPMVRLREGNTRSIEWPEVSFSLLETQGDRDVVVLSGPEPRLRWRTFCEQIVDVVTRLDVTMAISLGALLAEVHHAKPVSVFGASADATLTDKLDLRPSTYAGPTGIVGVLQDALQRGGIPTMSLWASVPTYVPSSTSPKAALALVERLSSVLGLTLTAADLKNAATRYERQIDDLLDDDDELADYAQQILLASVDEPEVVEAPRPLPMEDVDGEALIEDLEQFLRDQP
ncbi:MAG: PAC2 family protein [Actinobacteria bacterium]|nr:PAC2 family protein [Actinomycetota bacterium]